MAAKFKHTETYPLAKAELLEQVKRALAHCKFKITEIGEDEGVIHAKSAVNFWSWREKIEVNIDADGSVSMKSECVLPTQVVDWGKNKKNVQQFFAYLG